MPHRLRLTNWGFGYRDSKAQAYGQVASTPQAPEPCWRLQKVEVEVWYRTDVSPGAAAVPEAGLGMTKEGAFAQILI